MSSITRIMSGLPQLPGTKLKTKVKGDYIFSRALLPDGSCEASIIKKTNNGMTLVKSIFEDKFGIKIFKANEYEAYIDKTRGRRIFVKI